MLVIDPSDGRIGKANEAARHYYGYDRQTLLRMSIYDINQMPRSRPRPVKHVSDGYLNYPTSCS